VEVVMNNEQTIQSSIEKLRKMQSSYLLQNHETLSVGDKMLKDSIPATLTLLRVALRAIQLDPIQGDTTTGYRNEINLARAILMSGVVQPIELLEDTNDDPDF
jgi:hypothetical protein